MSDLLALIDLGSNAVRFLLASVIPGVGFQVLREKRMPIRLAGNPRGLLPPAAIKRTINAVQRFLKDVRQEGKPYIVAVATAAVREAPNCARLLEPLKRRAGVDVRVLSGEEEARLGAVAVLRSISCCNGTIIDLGGGSLQITQVQDGAIVHPASLLLGAVYLTARFLKHDPPTARELNALQRELHRQLSTVLPVATQDAALIGLGGTVRALGRVHAAAQNGGYQPPSGPLCLQREEITSLRERLAGLQLQTRRRVPGLKAERADIIVAGVTVIAGIMTLGNYSTLTVWPRGGVRHGILVYETFNGGL